MAGALLPQLSMSWLRTRLGVRVNQAGWPGMGPENAGRIIGHDHSGKSGPPRGEGYGGLG